MKRKEIIEELSKIKQEVTPGSPIEDFRRKMDNLIDKLKMDEIEDGKPKINVEVNINHPSELEDIEEKVQSVLMEIQRLNSMGRV